MVGWVYAFESPSMPGLVKIGATKRDPAKSLWEANSNDEWRLPDYSIAWAVNVEDPFASKRAIHALLAARRTRPRHDFFRATAEEARQVAMVLGLFSAME